MRGISKFLAMIMMTLGAMVIVGSTGCAVNDPSGGSSEAASPPVGEVTQAITGCELDCPNGGPVLTCSSPCSVPDANTLICNGVTSQCPPPPICIPHGCNGACGEVFDGCSEMLDCGSCESGCPAGKVDCCGEGACVTPATCRQLILHNIC